MLTTNKLTKIYRTDEIETTALNEINLHIEKGEFVAVMGPSGCGKSTLLNVLGLLDKPSDGEFIFNENEVSKLNQKQRTMLRKNSIGFIFQNFNLIDELTVFENVELPLLYNNIPTSKRQVMVNSVLESMEIAHRKNHYPGQLSGGQQQRVAVARAVVAKPDLILADEPTGNLDSKNGKEVMDILTNLNNDGTTIVIVTHSPTDAKYASRIIKLKDGMIVQGEVNNLL